MAPRPWANPEQLEFLKGHISTYWKYTNERRQAKFWDFIEAKWYEQWPELQAMVNCGALPEDALNKDKLTPDGLPLYVLTEDQQSLYQIALKERTKRITTWYRNSRKKTLGTANLSALTSASTLFKIGSTEKKDRTYQDEEVYHSLFKRKIYRQVQPEVRRKTANEEQFEAVVWESDIDREDFPSSDSDASDGTSLKNQRVVRKIGCKLSGLTDKERYAFEAVRMSVLREVRKSLWEKESEAVKRRVQEEKERLKEENKKERDAKDKDSNLEGLKRSSEDRQRAIDSLVNVLQSTCKEINRLTGWSTLIISGGPNPAQANKIAMRTVTYGKAPSIPGFPNSYASFGQNVAEPYLHWLKQVYADPLTGAYNSDSLSDNKAEAAEQEAERKSSPLLQCSPIHPSSPLPLSSPLPQTSPLPDLPQELVPWPPTPPMPHMSSQALLSEANMFDGPQGINKGPSEPLHMAFVRSGLARSNDSIGDSSSGSTREDTIAQVSLNNAYEPVIDPSLLQGSTTAAPTIGISLGSRTATVVPCSKTPSTTTTPAPLNLNAATITTNSTAVSTIASRPPVRSATINKELTQAARKPRARKKASIADDETEAHANANDAEDAEENGAEDQGGRSRDNADSEGEGEQNPMRDEEDLDMITSAKANQRTGLPPGWTMTMEKSTKGIKRGRGRGGESRKPRADHNPDGAYPLVTFNTSGSSPNPAVPQAAETSRGELGIGARICKARVLDDGTVAAVIPGLVAAENNSGPKAVLEQTSVAEASTVNKKRAVLSKTSKTTALEERTVQPEAGGQNTGLGARIRKPRKLDDGTIAPAVKTQGKRKGADTAGKTTSKR